jgi:hypothetical protein
MRNTSRLGALLCVCALACGDQSDAARAAIHTDSLPIALDNQLLFVEGASERAHLLNVEQPKPAAQTTQVKLPAGATVSQRRIAHDEGLILCAGLRGSTMVEAQAAALVAIDNAGKSRTYTLGTTPFNTLTQSDDGRFAVLYRTGQNDDRTLNNPNELVVVDLDKQPADDGAVTRKTPDGLGHTLTRVIVSPALRIAEEDRRLLVVLSAAEVTLFDLNHLTRRATIVQLDETRLINPTQVVFGAPNPTLYVRAQNSDNIFMFRFEKHDTANDPERNDFRPTINPISGGIGPRDIALFGDASEQRLLVVAEGSSQALVIDPSSSKTVSLKLSAAAQHILLFKASSPTDPQTRNHALLYSDKSNQVTFLDLDGLSDSPEDKLEQLQLADTIASLIPLLDQGEVVLLHARGVTLVSLAERTLTPISASAALSGALFEPKRERLWVGPTGQPWIGTLDLMTGKTNEILLDAKIQAIVPMFGANRLAVMHSSDVGYVTLVDLDTDTPSRTSAISVRGFFISGSLDRSE